MSADDALEKLKKYAAAYGASPGKITALQEKPKLKPILMMKAGALVEVPAQVVVMDISGGETVMLDPETFTPAQPVSVNVDAPSGLGAAKVVADAVASQKGFLSKIKANKQAQVDAHGGYTVVYTDGGCQTSPPHIGAWAYTVTRPNQPPMTGFGILGDTTNNRMELLAIYRVLEELEIGPPIKLYADSMYAINCATEWGPSWIKKGWITADGKPVKNRDLIEPIVLLTQLHTIQFIHVKGHAGLVGNEYVDDLCTQAITKAHFQWKMDVPSLQLDPGVGK